MSKLSVISVLLLSVFGSSFSAQALDALSNDPDQSNLEVIVRHNSDDSFSFIYRDKYRKLDFQIGSQDRFTRQELDDLVNLAHWKGAGLATVEVMVAGGVVSLLPIWWMAGWLVMASDVAGVAIPVVAIGASAYYFDSLNPSKVWHGADILMNGNFLYGKGKDALVVKDIAKFRRDLDAMLRPGNRHGPAHFYPQNLK